MRIIRWFISAFLLSTLFWALMPSKVVLADQANPDSIPTMTANVYRNLLETGDQLYIFYANIPYASGPDALVTEAFIWRLIDTDNLTVIGQTVGTAYNADGYGYNVYSMYFSAADTPTWDQPYTVRLSGNPVIFDSPPIYDFILSIGDFNTETLTSAVRSALTTRVLSIAIDLNLRWALATADSLISEQETGTVLSLNGEAFFRGAIFGLQALAPQLFQVTAGLITATDRTWDPSYASNITAQYTGTFVETAQTAGADMFGKGYDLVSIIFLLIILVAVIAGNLLITNHAWSGLIDVTLVAVIFARIGIPAVLLTFLGLIGAMAWIYISAKVWGFLR